MGLQTKTGIAAELDANLEDLPTPPWVAIEVIRLSNDDNSTIRQLADVLGQDPVMAARLLKLANSPFYSRGGEITSLERAASLLGQKTVKLMALSFSLTADLAADGGALDLRQYWYHSLVNATAARRWSEVMGAGLAEECFLAGLISHLGRLVVAQRLAGPYRELMERVGSWPTAEAEREAFGFTSSDVTERLLDAWQLPPLIARPTSHMFNPEGWESGSADADHVFEALRLAALTEAVLTRDESGTEFDRLRTEVARHGVDDVGLDLTILELESRIRDAADLLDVGLPPGVSHQRILDEARLKLVALSIDTALSLQTERAHSEELRRVNAELEAQAATDRLTGIANRGAFDDFLGRHVAARMRREIPDALGLLIVDLDHFKAVNDTHGHHAGDEVLRAAATALQAAVRSDELLTRYGGEEFAVVAPIATVDGLTVLGERLRAAVEELGVSVDGTRLKVTASVGGACITDVLDQRDGVRLIQKADACLYEAKHAGRNAVVISRDPV
ncbi:MAG: GGDEF domain-containing protein [Acidimicrobiales bacterium]|nr:GGDEF domain-containing protein [Acidimicrobiales bacterium]